MKSLILSNEHRRILEQSAESCWPEECCGILIGRRIGDFSVVDAVQPAANVAKGDRTRRYEIDPQTVFDALRTAKETGQQVLGFYHSHPDGSAVLSATDAEAVWFGRVYLIVVMTDGRAVGMRGWMVPEAGLAAVEVTLELTESG